jgi:hypothetical protein
VRPASGLPRKASSSAARTRRRIAGEQSRASHAPSEVLSDDPSTYQDYVQFARLAKRLLAIFFAEDRSILPCRAHKQASTLDFILPACIEFGHWPYRR